MVNHEVDGSGEIVVYDFAEIHFLRQGWNNCIPRAVSKTETSNHEERRHGMSYWQIAAVVRSLSVLRAQFSTANKQGPRHLVLLLIIASAVSACDGMAVVAADPSCAQLPGGGLVENNALLSPTDATHCSSMAPFVW
jgi:hypothetical protein